MQSLIIYCRSGFENDAAAEINYHASLHHINGYVKAKPNTGWIQYECFHPEEAKKLIKKTNFDALVFARQWFLGVEVTDMPLTDRVSALEEALVGLPTCGELRLETPDTNEGKELSKLCKKLTPPLSKRLEQSQHLARPLDPSKPILHVLFLKTDRAMVGYSYPNNNSPFLMGIPRLKLANDAPSRSSLKLDEAFKLFFTPSEREARLQSGMKAVDLGACPGGWTYQLVRRGLFVTAIDNGAIDEKLMETGQVTHHQVDGFKYRPEKRNIEWLVCDMVEKPSRITALMIDWVIGGHAKQVIFNLKLPMKKRFEQTYQNLQKIEDRFNEHGIEYQLKAKQLYHDREEITLYLNITKPPAT